MDNPRGNWSGGAGDGKTALEHDIRCGGALLNQESGDWPAYFAVSSPSAYNAGPPSPGPRARRGRIRSVVGLDPPSKNR